MEKKFLLIITRLYPHVSEQEQVENLQEKSQMRSVYKFMMASVHEKFIDWYFPC